MAGQRGTNANAGLIARQAAMQGAANQQAAIGQGATLQAQQSLNALNAAGGMANTQVGQQQAALNAYNQAAQGQQANILNTINNQNAIQSGLSQFNAGQAQSAAGGLLQGIGTAAHLIPGKAEGGMITADDKVGPISEIGKFIKGFAFGGVSDTPPNIINKYGSFSDSNSEKSNTIGQGLVGLGKLAFAASKGGEVPAMVSPGELYLTPEAVSKVAASKDKEKIIPKVAEKIPGKAKVKGNSEKNDVVAKKLEEGGIVVPRTDTDSKDAAKFIAAVLAKQGLKRK